MKSATEEEASRKKPEIDLVTAITKFHSLSSEVLYKLIRDARHGTIQWTKGNGVSFEINVQSLARSLTLHLIAKLLTLKRDEQHLTHLLCGFRLLHTLCDLAHHHSIPTLKKVLVNDVELLTQMFDLIFFTNIFLSTFRQEIYGSSNMVFLHSALLASSLYLFTAFTAITSSELHELAPVLLTHPKVDIFMSAAFPAVRVVINFLQGKLFAQNSGIHILPNVSDLYGLCEHCEASVQFLHSLCQQKFFCERLVKNKVLCEEGGVLQLVRDIMRLPLYEDPHLKAVICRLKSKVLSIMLHLCEVESISFLNLAASTTDGLDLAKSTVFEVLEVLKMMFCGDPNGYHPKGILQLNAMRLTQILSQHSYFRSYIVFNLTEDLMKVFSLPHGEFLCSWCSSDSEPCEADVTLNYDSLLATGQMLGVISSSIPSQSPSIPSRASHKSYSRQTISLLVRTVANLVYKEEKGFFLSTFLHCLLKELPNIPTEGVERAVVATRNLRSLSVHAESLGPGYLNEDDVKLLRLFIRQLEQLITPQESNLQRFKEVDSRGPSSRSAPQRLSLDRNKGLFVNLAADRPNHSNLEEKQLKKRKRSMMNTVQIEVIENALQFCADNISLDGSELTPFQLKNWLNNRTAKLAREAAKDVLVRSRGTLSETDSVPTKSLKGQNVVVTDGEGKVIGKGRINLRYGIWFGKHLRDSGLCVVDVTELYVDEATNLAHPLYATGSTFRDAQKILEKRRVLWDSNKLLLI